MKIRTVGSICSGIEAASVAWKDLNFKFSWFSEISEFPSLLLKEKYPLTPNLGDMNGIPKLINENKIENPDLICGGTPCQAFSLAGWKNGLKDDRGNLTLKFVDIVEANDNVRTENNQEPSYVFWENVEGVLKDKTNAFGCFISSLAGFDETINMKCWPNAGVVRGPKRNIAWRVIDAKYFGVPQQRRRLYLLAGGKNFYPENVLFERINNELEKFPETPLMFEKEGHKFEVFRNYTDCLYSAYGTKWNGNAAAYNGSLFVVQDDKIRRLSPLECERLMGFPDNYTDIYGASFTKRYQAIGNSWAVPVIKWIGKNLVKEDSVQSIIPENNLEIACFTQTYIDGEFINCNKDLMHNMGINCTTIPDNCIFSDMKEIVSPDASEKIYLSPVGCHGIVRRKNERKLQMNPRLENILNNTSLQMTEEEIEKRSKVQKRGKKKD